MLKVVTARVQHALGLATATMRRQRWDGALLARRIMSAQHGTNSQKLSLL